MTRTYDGAQTSFANRRSNKNGSNVGAQHARLQALPKNSAAWVRLDELASRKTSKLAKWHWLAVNGESDRELFAFPGIWQHWRGPTKKDGPIVELDVYAFMTTKPNALTASINHERMPVLLSGDAEFQTWLSGSPAEAFALAQSFDPARMRIVQSGLEKKDLLAA